MTINDSRQLPKTPAPKRRGILWSLRTMFLVLRTSVFLTAGYFHGRPDADGVVGGAFCTRRLRRGLGGTLSKAGSWNVLGVVATVRIAYAEDTTMPDSIKQMKYPKPRRLNDFGRRSRHFARSCWDASRPKGHLPSAKGPNPARARLQNPVPARAFGFESDLSRSPSTSVFPNVGRDRPD